MSSLKWILQTQIRSWVVILSKLYKLDVKNIILLGLVSPIYKMWDTKIWTLIEGFFSILNLESYEIIHSREWRLYRANKEYYVCKHFGKK